MPVIKHDETEFRSSALNCCNQTVFGLLFICTLMIFTSIKAEELGSMVEYCQLETFSPRCRYGHVIVMKSAHFGRMKLGKCIDGSSFSGSLKQDQDTLGCSADVLEYADETCSGRQGCDIAVPNRHLLGTRPCLAQLTMYFEASFDCVEVVEEDRSCTVLINTASPVHLLGSTLYRGDQQQSAIRCGTRSSPWIIEVQTGQQINVSLLDFGRQRSDRSVVDYRTSSDVTGSITSDDRRCEVQYGYILDKAAAAANRKNASICSTRNKLLKERKHFIYQSTGNSIEIVVDNAVLSSFGTPNESRPSFLLALTAVGCSNLVPPADTWLRRTGNEATVGCYTTRQRWQLKCQEGQWKGAIGQCVEDMQASAKDDSVESESTFSHKDGYHEGGTVGITSCFASELEHTDDELKVRDTAMWHEFRIHKRRHIAYSMLIIVAVAGAGTSVCIVIIFVGIGCSRRYQSYNGRRTRSIDINKSLVNYSVEDCMSPHQMSLCYSPEAAIEKTNRPTMT